MITHRLTGIQDGGQNLDPRRFAEPSRALKSTTDQGPVKSDTVIAFGRAVKWDEKDAYKGRVQLVVFTDPEDPDLSGEFFDGKTDFGSHDTSDVYWDHGLDDTVKREVIGKSTLAKDDAGIWMDYQLDKANKYARRIAKLPADKKSMIGASSGTASHLVEREDVLDEGGKKLAVWIKKWPLGLDASLTMTPCEPKTVPALTPIKSYTPGMSFKTLTEDMDDDAEIGAVMTTPYTYAKEPTIGHALPAKLIGEHADLAGRLLRNRTVGVSEFGKMMSGFGDAVNGYLDSMKSDVKDRKLGMWDDSDVYWKSAGPHMKTVRDAVHAVLTRAHNAGADHLLSRGHVSADEHVEMRKGFDSMLGTYLSGLDDGVLDRDLSSNGSEYLYIKSDLAATQPPRDGKTVADETEALLADADALTGRAKRLCTRLDAVRSQRAVQGRELGPKSLGHIDTSAAALEGIAESLKALRPRNEEDADSLLADSILKASLALAS